jgi:hypothetical protein
MSRYSNQKRAKKAASSKPASVSKTAGMKMAIAPDAMSDVKQRKEKMNAAVIQLDPALFAEHLVGWLEATDYMRNRAEAAQSKDPIAALGGAIPQFSSSDLDQPRLRTVADDAVFAFCIAAALKPDPAAPERLEALLSERFGTDFPGREALDCCRKGAESDDPLDNAVSLFIKEMLEEKAFDPRDVWNAGLRLLEKVRKSNFVHELIVPLCKWHRNRWTQITTQQLFNLTRPSATVPPIEDVLRDNHNDQAFVARLLIAATRAVDLGLDEAYSEHLKNLARRD